MTAAALLLGVGADLALGDPARRHPVAGFGSLVLEAERRGYAPTRARGAALTTSAVLSTAAAVLLVERVLARAPLARTAFGGAVVWSTLGGRSLWRIAGELADLLERGEIDAARALLPSLAGRDPRALSAGDLARAGTESVAENTSDAVIGALFYGALLGPAGAAAFRAANTLDAMVGHHSPRYERFGWASARLDDVLGFLPARLGAWLTVLAAPTVGGSSARAMGVLLRDGRAHPSPNAGPMEASFAGSLGIQLGGPLHYGHRLEERPVLGDGRAPDVGALRGAVRLSQAITAGSTVAALGIRGGIWLWKRRARSGARVTARDGSPEAGGRLDARPWDVAAAPRAGGRA